MGRDRADQPVDRCQYRRQRREPLDALWGVSFGHHSISGGASEARSSRAESKVLARSSATFALGREMCACCATRSGRRDRHPHAPIGDIFVQSVEPTKRRFQLVLIKPSHYDDDGYVIRWWRAMIPSNSLAAVYGIAADCAERQVLGPDVAIDIMVLDETNTRIDVSALLARFRQHDGFGLLALIGVQTNQYPRALDIARPFRAAGIQVAIGGFHVSGCLSMLDGRAVELDAWRGV